MARRSRWTGWRGSCAGFLEGSGLPSALGVRRRLSVQARYARRFAMRYLTLAATASVGGDATPPRHQQLSATDRIIEEDMRVRLPLLPCTVPQAAIRIAESLPAPLGLELVPEPCGETGKNDPDQRDEVVLTGMSVIRAFDCLVELDERYVWSEVDGVLILRPGMTWFDPSHFLNRKIPAFRVKDGRMWAAMDAVHLALGGARGPADEVWPASTPQSDRMFSRLPGYDDRSRCAQCRCASAWVSSVDSGILQASGSFRICHVTSEYVRRWRHWTSFGDPARRWHVVRCLRQYEQIIRTPPRLRGPSQLEEISSTPQEK